MWSSVASQGSNGGIRVKGRSASQADASLAEAGCCVGCLGPAAPLLGKDSKAVLSWGCSQTHPASPPGSWPISESGQACSPQPPSGTVMQAQEAWATEKPWGSPEKDGGQGAGPSQRARLSILLFGLHLTGQRDGALERRLVFRRFPACHLLWFLPNCSPGKCIFGVFVLFSLATPCRIPRGILVPRPGIEPGPPAVEVQSLNRWTKEVPGKCIFESSRERRCRGPEA